MYTENKVRKFIADYKAMSVHIELIWSEWKHIAGKSPYAEMSYFEFDKDNIVIYWDEYWAKGGHESGTHSFPIEYLCDKNWTQKLKDEIEEKKRKDEEEKTRKKEEARKKQEELEYQNYLTLKEKFEKGNE